MMRLEDLPTPVPGPGEALVRVAAAGLNFIDVYHRVGLYKVPLPQPLGREGAGAVEAVGPNVSGVAPGDRVAWVLVPGSYASHVVVPADRLVTLPDGVSFEAAAAVMLQGMTAHYLTHSTYPLKTGDTCLIHAAAGGVGLLVVQMAKMRGARVIGTVSTEAKAGLARDAGADEIVLYSQQDFESEVKRLTNGRGVNVVYDSVGQDTFDKGLNCLVPRGYMVLFGQSSGPVAPVDPQTLNDRGSLFLTRPMLGHYIASREELVQRGTDVLTWVAQGKLKVRIDRTYPLAEVAKAHDALTGRQTAGKVLLIP